MSILGAVGSALGDVAHGAENVVNDVAKPLTGASAGQDLSHVAVVLGDAGSAVGHAAVTTLGQPAPTYQVNPQTGQTQVTQAKPEPGMVFRNMLMAGLEGLSASKPGQTPGEALGAGFAAQQKTEQQNQLLAQRQAQQQFANEMNSLRTKDYNKYIQSQIATNTARAITAREQAKLMGREYQDDLQNSYQKANAFHVSNGDTRVGTLPAGNEMQELQSFKADHPGLLTDFAQGQVTVVARPDGGYDIWRAGDLNAPTKADIQRITGFKNGQPVYQTMKAGTISNRMANAVESANQMLISRHNLETSTIKRNAAEANASNARAQAAGAERQQIDSTRTLGSLSAQMTRLSKQIWTKNPDGSLAQINTPEAAQAKRQYDQLQQQYAKLTGAPYNPQDLGATPLTQKNAVWVIGPDGVGYAVPTAHMGDALAHGGKLAKWGTGAAASKTLTFYNSAGASKTVQANDAAAINAAVNAGFSSTTPIATPQQKTTFMAEPTQ